MTLCDHKRNKAYICFINRREIEAADDGAKCNRMEHKLIVMVVALTHVISFHGQNSIGAASVPKKGVYEKNGWSAWGEYHMIPGYT
jgi:hypothetical protein